MTFWSLTDGGAVHWSIWLKVWHSFSLLKLFAEQRASLLFLTFYLILSLVISFFLRLMIAGNHRREKAPGLAVLSSVAGWSGGVKQGSLWSVREMVPSRFSTHVCSEVINCPPKRKCCITLATVFPRQGLLTPSAAAERRRSDLRPSPFWIFNQKSSMLHRRPRHALNEDHSSLCFFSFCFKSAEAKCEGSLIKD